MGLSLEAKADLVMDAIKEDRSEIRIMTERIYTVASSITVSSFAITSFLIGLHAGGRNQVTTLGWPFFVIIDAAFLIMLWGLLLRLMRDVAIGQLFLEARENMLRNLYITKDLDRQPFDVFSAVDITKKPKIHHNNLYWILGSSTGAIIVKLAAVISIS
jgi:hypothetical protein